MGKEGFVPVLTSYLAAVEHMGELLLRGDIFAMFLVFTMVLIGGPTLYGFTLLLGRSLKRRLDYVKPTIVVAAAQPARKRRFIGVKLALCATTIAISFFGLLIEASSSHELPTALL